MGTIKKREVLYPGPNSWHRYETRGINPPASFITHFDQKSKWVPFAGTQVTESESHTAFKRFRSHQGDFVSFDGDVGGDFTTQKSYVESPAVPEAKLRSTGWYTPFVGAKYEERHSSSDAILPLLPASMPFPPSGRSSDSALAVFGSTAIARCAPSNNVASLSASLRELYTEGIPHILGHSFWKARTRPIRKAHKATGEEYLNVQFGWKPLVGDIKSFASGVSRFSDKYKQVARDNGKVVRRRYEFPSTHSEQVTKIVSSGPTLVGNYDNTSLYTFLGGSRDVYKVRQTTQRRWFSGAFTYYIPNLDESIESYSNFATKLLGLDLNPETLWEMAPWSWAVDWFTNAGDVIHNVNAWSSDGLVLKYGYIMEHTIVRDIYTWVGDTRFKPDTVYPDVVVLVTETKLRRRATPFGFGLTFSSLTKRQKAIAAALGLTRL